jgi:hypothetical protein
VRPTPASAATATDLDRASNLAGASGDDPASAPGAAVDEAVVEEWHETAIASEPVDTATTPSQTMGVRRPERLIPTG